MKKNFKSASFPRGARFGVMSALSILAAQHGFAGASCRDNSSYFTMKLQKIIPGLNRHARLIFVAFGLTICAAVRAQTAYQTLVLGDNPLAYYALNPGADGTGTAPDLTGNGNNGQASGIVAGTGPSQFITNAAYFNGAASIDLSGGANSNLLNFSGPITLEAWVQPSSSSLFGDIVAKGYDSSTYAEIVLRVNGPYGANYYGSSGSVGENGGVQSTNWTYMVVSSDGTNCSLYQNGVLVAQGADANGAVLFSDDWVIGNGSSAGNTRFFNGNISQVAIYNQGLTAAQVLTHFYIGMVNSYPSNSAPIITSQPQSQSVYVGGSATFKVQSVSEFPVTNQWYKAGVALPGQTNATLKVLNVNAAAATNYTVVVGNINGRTTSAPAALSLLVPGVSLLWRTNNNNGTWDTGTSTNWINISGGAPSVFNASDSVLFNDDANQPTTVTVNGNVSPSLITVNSSINAFTFSGSGAITGSGSLFKEGSSLLTINAAGSFTGSVNIEGGAVYAGSNSLDSVSAISITNGATLDVAGGSIPNDTPVSVSGVGVNGHGAVINSVANYPSESFNVTLAGDTLFGASARWDFASGSQISGPHNLILDWSGGAGYSQWNTVTVGSDVLGVFVTNGINPSSSSTLGMSFDSTICQNPGTLFTFAPGCTLTFYNGGFNGSIHALSNATVNIYTAPAAFNGSNLILENGASWISYYNAGATTPINSAVTLNGVAHFVIGDHYMVYTNRISGPGGFVLDYYNNEMVMAASNTYTGPTIIGSSGNTPAVGLTGNGSISHSSLIFFGGASPSLMHLDVSGRSDQTFTLASGQTLAGVGSINGSLVVSPGATISPGGTNTTIGITTGSNATGTLVALGNISLGGITLIRLDGSANDAVVAGANITYGGTLSLQNISGTALAAGNSFQVFTGTGSGAFSSITPTTPGPGLAWDTTQLLSGGVINVIAANAPTISSAKLSGGRIVLSGSGGKTNGTYYVLTTTNLTANNWFPIATNSYDASGNFTSTNAILPGAAQQFYRLQQ